MLFCPYLTWLTKEIEYNWILLLPWKSPSATTLSVFAFLALASQVPLWNPFFCWWLLVSGGAPKWGLSLLHSWCCVLSGVTSPSLWWQPPPYGLFLSELQAWISSFQEVYKHLELNMLDYKFVTSHSKPTSELADGKRTAAYPRSQARPGAPPCTHFPQYCWWSRPTQSPCLLSSSPLLTFSPAPTRFRSPFLPGIPASGFPPFSSGLKICPLPTHPPLSVPIAFQNANLTSSGLSLKSFIDPS